MTAVFATLVILVGLVGSCRGHWVDYRLAEREIRTDDDAIERLIQSGMPQVRTRTYIRVWTQSLLSSACYRAQSAGQVSPRQC
jgi:hypothetical protein